MIDVKSFFGYATKAVALTAVVAAYTGHPIPETHVADFTVTSEAAYSAIVVAVAATKSIVHDLSALWGGVTGMFKGGAQ